MQDQQNTIKDPKHPAAALLKIVHGDTKNLQIPHKTIITGKKIKNVTLRKFVETFLESGKIEPATLVEVLLAFDEAVEKEYLTEEVLEAIRKDPKLLDKFINQEEHK